MMLLAYPSLIPMAQSIHTENEIYDVTISDTNVKVILQHVPNSSYTPHSWLFPPRQISLSILFRGNW